MRCPDASSLVAAGLLALGAQEALPSADAVLTELKAGNAHHVRQEGTNTRIRRRRASMRWRQARPPHCAILACADSRVPPEIVFDEGLGGIFAVRIAGNVHMGQRNDPASISRPSTCTCR